MAHKYEIGQRVQLTAADPTSSRIHSMRAKTDAKVKSDGIYEITRLMPEDQAGVVSYRLKSDAGERVAPENDLAEADATVA